MSTDSNSGSGTPRQGLPRWMKRRVPKGGANRFTADLLDQLHLETVCDHARCPNRGECYASRTATFLILGDRCTRDCRFCSVEPGRPRPVDVDEPRRVAEAVARMQLRHVVITCVTRDDLPDGGAGHFCRCIEAIRGVTDATVEVLPSDFAGNADAVRSLVAAAPDVYNHNCETVPRLFGEVRGPMPDYRRTLEIFRLIREIAPSMRIKTGLMLGLGETAAELLDTLAELYASGCDMLTLGQYLRPSPRQLPVVRFYEPEEFDRLCEQAKAIGFKDVAAGPFVRSSYHAGEMLNPTDS